MTAADWISDRRALLDAATEGPWCYQPWSAYPLPSGDYAESILLANASPDGEIVRGLSDNDGDLIADARTSLPAALDALEAVLELHKRTPLYESCEDEDCELPAGDHDEVSAGEWVHITVREGEICAHCSDLINDLIDWPCETAMAITAALGIEVQP